MYAEKLGLGSKTGLEVYENTGVLAGRDSSTWFEGNTVQAERGRIRMLSADCPDGLCVGMGWSSSPAKPIVCLPNRVTIIIEGGDAGPDAAAG